VGTVNDGTIDHASVTYLRPLTAWIRSRRVMQTKADSRERGCAHRGCIGIVARPPGEAPEPGACEGCLPLTAGAGRESRPWRCYKQLAERMVRSAYGPSCVVVSVYHPVCEGRRDPKTARQQVPSACWSTMCEPRRQEAGRLAPAQRATARRGSYPTRQLRCRIRLGRPARLH